MVHKYDPKEHIEHVEIAPRSEDILDQREITIRSYKTTVPFDAKLLEAGLDRAWLSPNIRFGVFSRSRPAVANDRFAVVLGLQDALSVRTYDYDARRPLWYSWRNVIVDTISVRYEKDDDGFVRFTTAGGGQRITDEKISEFNSTYLKLPSETVTKRQFNLDKLRDLCFSRFVDRLYMVRFSDPDGEEYRSIDHALFQSRDYIDPNVKRLKEVRADKQAKIESFDSDIQVRPPELSAQAQVRFFIRGISGALRLRFPKMNYTKWATTPEEQAEIFYAVVNTTVESILDADYYAEHQDSLRDLNKDSDVFPEMIDLTRFTKVLSINKNREEFFRKIDLQDARGSWLPHLRAIDGLLPTGKTEEQVCSLVVEMTTRSPSISVRILRESRADSKLKRIGMVIASVLSDQLQMLSPSMRPLAEEALLAWNVDHVEDAWDVDPDTGVITVGNLRWRKADLSLDALASVLRKLISVVLHRRLVTAHGDLGPILRRFNWCIAVAKELPSNHTKVSPALRLVADNCVPTSIADGGRVLKSPPADLPTLDDIVLRDFGLPLWPSFEAVRVNKQIVVRNTGVGVALSLKAMPTGTLFSESASPPDFNLPPSGETAFAMSDNPTALDVRFMKYGKERIVTVAVHKSPVSDQAKQTAEHYNWASQAEVGRAIRNILSDQEAPDKGTVSRAIQRGQLLTNGKSGRACRVNVESLKSWITGWAKLDATEAHQIVLAVIAEINSRKG